MGKRATTVASQSLMDLFKKPPARSLTSSDDEDARSSEVAATIMDAISSAGILLSTTMFQAAADELLNGEVDGFDDDVFEEGPTVETAVPRAVRRKCEPTIEAAAAAAEAPTASTLPSESVELFGEDAAAAAEAAAAAATKTVYHKKDPAVAGETCGILALSARPTCGKCGYECDPLRSQLKSKGAGKWQCNSCNTRQCMLSKMCNGFPNADFKALSENDQTAFWIQAREAANGHRLKEILINTFIRKRTDQITARIGGTYLPLTVYQSMGYDVDLIQSQCSDYKQHPVLGTVYRVVVESIQRETIESKVREEILRSIVKKNGPPQPTASIEAEPEQLSQTSYSSSSSSSSSNKKHKSKKHDKKKSKKSKKSKKNKSSSKDNAKTKPDKKDKSNPIDDAERKAKKEKDDQVRKDKVAGRKVQVLAEKLMAKVTPTLFILKQDIDHPLASKVAAFASESVKKLHAQLTKMNSLSQAKLKCVSLEGISPFPWTLEEVAQVKACTPALCFDRWPLRPRLTSRSERHSPVAKLK